jgi:hypothetical protein
MYFPTICVDNFFDDPQAVRDLAFSLGFGERTHRYPGERTKLLHEVAPEYFDYFCRRLMGVCYDFRKFDNISWNISTGFQLTTPYKNDDCVIDTGWIHRDQNALFAGVIYLAPGANLDAGTSVFNSKIVGQVPINLDKKTKLFTTNTADQEIKQAIEESNNRFVKTIEFKNVYNRMIAYGGEKFHGVNSFTNNDTEQRLTQVFFVNSVVADWYPIPHSKLGGSGSYGGKE